MALVSEIMADAKTRYRHTYTDNIVVGWLNAVHNRMWKLVPQDSLPTTIVLSGVGVYQLPDGVKRRYIKQVTMGPPSGPFEPLDFKEIDENDGLNSYYLSGNNIILQEPSDATALNPYLLFIFFDKTVPIKFTVADMNVAPELDEVWHEALTVGLLEMIAGARKDIKMKNNYASEFSALMGDFMLDAVDADPDYPSCKDELPRRSRYGSSVED